MEEKVLKNNSFIRSENEFYDPIDAKDKPKTKKSKSKKTPSKWFQRWFFGVGKEFRRMSWENRSNVFKNFCVTVVICLFLALIFLGIDMLMLIGFAK